MPSDANSTLLLVADDRAASAVELMVGLETASNAGGGGAGALAALSAGNDSVVPMEARSAPASPVAWLRVSGARSAAMPCLIAATTVSWSSSSTADLRRMAATLSSKEATRAAASKMRGAREPLRGEREGDNDDATSTAAGAADAATPGNADAEATAANDNASAGSRSDAPKLPAAGFSTAVPTTSAAAMTAALFATD